MISDEYLETCQLSAFALITVISLIFGISPYYLVWWYKKSGQFRSQGVQSFISGVICFSGGTLLGVTFLHLMPEMRRNLEDVIKHPDRNDSSFLSNTDLPMGDILVCCGFFFVYIFDEIMHMFIEWYIKSSEKRANRKKKRPDEKQEEASVKSHRFTCNLRGTFFPCFCVTETGSHFHLHHPDGHRKVPQSNQVANQPPTQPANSAAANAASVSVADLGHADTHLESAQHYVGPLSGLITIIALSFHDIFEGLAIGVETKSDAVLLLYLSIATHKYAIAFCIGLDLAISSTRLCVIWVYMGTYSIVSPIGIAIGMVLGTNLDLPATVVMQGLAGGTLIYVVCFEVLQREGSDTHIKGILNAFCVVIGFLLTLLFLVLLE